MTLQNVSNPKESASASEEIDTQAENLCDFIGNLVDLGCGSANGRGKRHRKSRPLKPGQNLSQEQSKRPWLCCETVQNVLLIPLSAGLRFFTVPRLALNPDLIFEIGSSFESLHGQCFFLNRIATPQADKPA